MKDLTSKYIVIEGPIGVGKTSLSNKLALEWDAELILENVDDNPFLTKFYKNPREVSLQTQLYFLLTRTRQVQGFKQQDIFSKARVSDFMLQKDRLFAQVTLNNEEYDLYDQLYSYMTVDIPTPDLLIYFSKLLPLFFILCIKILIGACRYTNKSGVGISTVIYEYS